MGNQDAGRPDRAIEHETIEHEAIEGVRRTIAVYAPLCDDGRFAEWADLFVEDGRFHVMKNTLAGRAEIREVIEGAMPEEIRGRHMCGMPVVDLVDGGREARAWTDFAFVDQAGQILVTGRYHDELAPGADGRWRFVLREVVFRGDAPEIARPVPG